MEPAIRPCVFSARLPYVQIHHYKKSFILMVLLCSMCVLYLRNQSIEISEWKEAKHETADKYGGSLRGSEQKENGDRNSETHELGSFHRILQIGQKLLNKHETSSSRDSNYNIDIQKPLNKQENSKSSINTDNKPRTQYNSDVKYAPPFFIMSQPTHPGSTKVIIFHTRYFGSSWEGFVAHNDRKALQLCPVSNCVFVHNASRPEDADAVIFHYGDFSFQTIPTVRRQHQRYIWLTQEAPTPGNIKANQYLQDLSYRNKFGYEGFFNWTATYNRHSDIYLPYGGLHPQRDGGEDNFSNSRSIVLDTSGPTYRQYIEALERGDTPLYDTKFSSRYKMAAWMVSHCSTVSGREFYVKELQKYIDVAVYGRCGPYKCGKNNKDTYCYTKVLSPTYKFYLAFENSMCVDYLTEKVWEPLRHGLVPVVFGGADYTAFLPPNSYIDATHISPKHLSRLLIRVANSSKEYGRYHLWRQHWKVRSSFPLCELCQKLHETNTAAVMEQLHHRTTGRGADQLHGITATGTQQQHHRSTERGTEQLDGITVNGTEQQNHGTTAKGTKQLHGITAAGMQQERHESTTSETKQMIGLGKWWQVVNNGSTSYPFDTFPRPPEPDTRTTLEKMKYGGKLLASVFGSLITS